MQVGGPGKEVWARGRPGGLTVLSPPRVGTKRSQSVPLEVEPHCGPVGHTQSQGRGTSGWPHSPHVSVLDGPVVGGPGMSIVQHGRILTTAQQPGEVNSPSSPSRPRRGHPTLPRGHYRPPSSRGPAGAVSGPQSEVRAGSTTAPAP